MRTELIWGQEVLTRHSRPQRHKGRGPRPTAPRGKPAVTHRREPHPLPQLTEQAEAAETPGPGHARNPGSKPTLRAGRPSRARLPRRPPSAQKTNLSTSGSTETRQSTPAHDRTKLEISNQNMSKQAAGVENQNNKILNNAASAKGEVYKTNTNVVCTE